MKETKAERTMYFINVGCFYVNCVLLLVNAVLGNLGQAFLNVCVLGVCLLGIEIRNQRIGNGEEK